MRQALLALVQHAGVEPPRDPAEARRESVNRQQQGPPAPHQAPDDQPIERLVVGRVIAQHAPLALRVRESGVPRQGHAVCLAADQRRVVGAPVEVDPQPRPAPADRARVEGRGQGPRDRPGPEIETPVVAQDPAFHREGGLALREPVGRVLAGQHELRQRARLQQAVRTRNTGRIGHSIGSFLAADGSLPEGRSSRGRWPRRRAEVAR